MGKALEALGVPPFGIGIEEWDVYDVASILACIVRTNELIHASTQDDAPTDNLVDKVVELMALVGHASGSDGYKIPREAWTLMKDDPEWQRKFIDKRDSAMKSTGSSGSRGGDTLVGPSQIPRQYSNPQSQNRQATLAITDGSPDDTEAATPSPDTEDDDEDTERQLQLLLQSFKTATSFRRTFMGATIRLPRSVNVNINMVKVRALLSKLK